MNLSSEKCRASNFLPCQDQFSEGTEPSEMVLCGKEKTRKSTLQMLEQENIFLKKMGSEKEKLLEFQSEQMKQMQANFVSTMKRSSSVNNEVIEYNRKLQQELSQLREQLTLLQHLYRQKVAAHNVLHADLQAIIEGLRSELSEVTKERDCLKWKCHENQIESKIASSAHSGTSSDHFDNLKSAAPNHLLPERNAVENISSTKTGTSTGPSKRITRRSTDAALCGAAHKGGGDPFEFTGKNKQRPARKPKLSQVDEGKELEGCEAENRHGKQPKAGKQGLLNSRKADRAISNTGNESARGRRSRNKSEKLNLSIKNEDLLGGISAESLERAGNAADLFSSRVIAVQKKVTLIDLDSPVTVVEKEHEEKVELIDLTTPETKSSTQNREMSPPIQLAKEKQKIGGSVSCSGSRKAGPSSSKKESMEAVPKEKAEAVSVAAIVRTRRVSASSVPSYKEPSLRTKMRRDN